MIKEIRILGKEVKVIAQAQELAHTWIGVTKIKLPTINGWSMKIGILEEYVFVAHHNLHSMFKFHRVLSKYKSLTGEGVQK